MRSEAKRVRQRYIHGALALVVNLLTDRISNALLFVTITLFYRLCVAGSVPEA